MSSSALDPVVLADSIKEWGRELGFQQVGITGVDLGEHEGTSSSGRERLLPWAAM